MWSGGSRSATASRCSSATPPTAGSPPWCCCRWRCCRGRRRRAGRSRSCMDGPGGCAGRCRGARLWPTACTRRRCPTRTGPRCWRPPDPPTARGRTSAACSRASRRPPAGAAKRPGRTSATRPATSDRLGPRPRGGQALRHHRRADPAGLPARPAAGGPGQDHAAGPGRAPAAGPGVARHRGAEPASGGPGRAVGPAADPARRRQGPGRRHGGRGPAHVAGPRRPRRRRGRPRAARACPRRPAFDMTERRLTPASRSAIIAPMRQWGWRAYLFFGAALAVAYYLVPPAFAKLVVWPVIGFSSAAVIVVGIRRNRPDRPLAWYLCAIGQVLFALGDTLYAVRVRVLHDPSTVFPSYIDFLYLAFYPCLAAGLWLLIRRRTPGRDTASLIDATIVSTGLALLAWVFLIVPYVRNPELRTVQRVVAVAYPLADVLVLAMAARLAVGSGQRPRAWAIMMASLAALIAGDVVFGLLQLDGTWQQGGPIDLTWIAFYVGWGVAALHPSMAALSRLAPVSVRLPRGRLVLITCASLIAPAVLVIQSVRNEPLDVPVIAGGSAVLFLLALARMSGLAVARHHVRRDSAVAADELLANLEDKATGEINELRRLMTQLRPPVLDELGLVSALQNQDRTFESASGVRCAIDTESELRLAPELETVLYRVTQESLTNVSKHANASKVNI